MAKYTQGDYIGQDSAQQWTEEILKRVKIKADRVHYEEDYSYTIELTGNRDWEAGNAYMKERYTDNLGGCSVVHKGNIVGRNYDWYYSDIADFTIKTAKASNVKYASIGRAGGIPELTDAFVKSGKYSELYEMLPFVTQDGINSEGLFAAMNVVPNDFGTTTGTVPRSTVQASICVLSLVRYVLDNFPSSVKAMSAIRDHISVWAPHKSDGTHEEIHIILADPVHTYLIEFIQNSVEITEMNNGYGGRNYMTNFHIHGTTVDDQNHINFSSVSPFGFGLERYNIIADNYDSIETVSDMTDLMLKLKYTNTYRTTTDPVWKTEFVDKSLGLRVTTDISMFENIISAARNLYKHRTRDSKTWQTVHTTVYDLESKTMYLIVQEQDKDCQVAVTYTPWDAQIGDLSKLQTNSKDNLVNAVNELSSKVKEFIPVTFAEYQDLPPEQQNSDSIIWSIKSSE